MISADLLGRHGKNLAVIFESAGQLSYEQLLEGASRIGEAVEPRSMVLCLCENSKGSLLGYVGFLLRKAVPLMLEAGLEPALVDRLREQYRPDYLWLPQRLKSSYANARVVGEFGDYVLLASEVAGRNPLFTELALLFTTSGSTGSPKLVRISYENLAANAASIAEYLSVNAEERPITTLPMNYSYGLSVVNSHLLRGACLLMTARTLMERPFWAFLNEHRATSLAGVPYHYEMLRRLGFLRMNNPSLKTLTQAGGKLRDSLVKEFGDHCASTGRRFFVMYGQTEATARISYLPPEMLSAKLGSIGRPIPGGHMEIVDDDLRPIGSGTGELVYRGRNVSLGYAERREDLARPDDNMGVLRTGDIARCDADGFFYIVGRKKRFIKLFGNRVSLDEAEAMARAIAADCACVGVDDKMTIYVTDASKADEVAAFLANRLGIHPSAFTARVIDFIPKNGSGKTNYSSLEAR